MARYAGVPSLPVLPFKHAYVVCDATPEIRNAPNIRDHDVNLYIKIQGESCHVGGYESNPHMLDQVMQLNDFKNKNEKIGCLSSRFSDDNFTS